MDGLECSEIRWSEIKEQASNYRLDSHYYEKKYVALNQKLSSSPHWLLRDIVLKPIQTGHTPSMSNSSYYGGKIAFIKTDNLRTNHITNSFSHFLSDEGNREISRTELREGDIITTIIGATEDVIARTALVLAEHLPANINQNIVQIRVNESIVIPEYVNCYLNGIYGRNYLRYLSRQTEQVNLNCQEVSSVVVPKVSMNFQNNIRECVLKAYQLQQDSKREFEIADKLLEGIVNVDVDCLSSITCKSLKSSMKASGRLDAEYYQPKYDVLFNKLSEFETANLGGKNGLADIVKSIEPGSEYYQGEGIPFIRVSDVDKFEISMPNIKLPYDIVANAEKLYPKKDTILFSKDGSVGIAHKVQEDMKAITSSALLHLTIKNTDVILPDYLTLVLNSPIVQLQAERDTSGAIIQHWKPSDIEKVVIPVLDMEVQKEIAAKVQESFKFRQESKRMLECAVKAVEMAIESDENTAIRWLEQELEVF